MLKKCILFIKSIHWISDDKLISYRASRPNWKLIKRNRNKCTIDKKKFNYFAPHVKTKFLFLCWRKFFKTSSAGSSLNGVVPRVVLKNACYVKLFFLHEVKFCDGTFRDCRSISKPEPKNVFGLKFPTRENLLWGFSRCTVFGVFI